MEKITVRGKEFKIELVNNYSSRLYQDTLLPALIRYHVLKSGIVQDSADALVGKTGDGYIAELRNQADIIKAKNAEINELAKTICDSREELLQEILVSNGYEFDKKWWDHKTSVEDINDFITTLFKPEEAKPSKKKQESTMTP